MLDNDETSVCLLMDTPDENGADSPPLARRDCVLNWTVLHSRLMSYLAMAKKKESTKESARATLTSILKEMAQPRFAKSARKEQEDTNHEETEGASNEYLGTLAVKIVVRD
jgi:hypothetical protein